MGRLFLVDLEGRTYNCKLCKTQLALVDGLISKELHCHRGKAYLFNNVVNITIGPHEERPMISGMHTVADIFCCCCGQIVGCKYRQESALDSSQKFKEGKFSLERGKIIDSMDSELYIDTRASTNMKLRNQPSESHKLQEQIQSFQEQVLTQLGNMQTSMGSTESQLGSFESRVAGLEVRVDEIYASQQKGTIPVSVQDIAQIFGAGPSRREQMPFSEDQVLAQLESLKTSIVSFIHWLGTLDSQVAGPEDNDTAGPSAGLSRSAFEEQVLAQFESLRISIVSINNRFRCLNSRMTELDVRLDGIRARLPPSPPSHPSQAS